MSELIARARSHGDRPAVFDEGGSHSFAELVAAAESSAAWLQAQPAWAPGERVAMMIAPGSEYVSVLWGIWLAGGIAVPLALTHPDAELEYVIEDAATAVMVADSEHASRLAKLAPAKACGTSDQLLDTAPDFTDPGSSEDAMLLYTSGTTGRAKGVVWRHEAIAAQAKMMTEAWAWRQDDRALLALPLHHVHGLINVVVTALWNGACVEMLPRFDQEAVWSRLGSGSVTVFMAVPTIYRRLIAAWDQFDAAWQLRTAEQLRRIRLMISGSAALPVPTLERWREISGHVLLERYGMTEIGMALSNSYAGERIPGAVGRPLPSVEARVVDEDDGAVAPGTPGRLQIRGPSVFHRYWRQPEATAESFVDGWFRTGDVVQADAAGVYRILGRASVDIIKTGGEKVSALEIEEVIRRLPGVGDCAVVGIPDDQWGELVTVAVTAAADLAAPGLDEIRDFCRDKLAPAKIPRRSQVVEALPRNALGKVMKPQLKEQLTEP